MIKIVKRKSKTATQHGWQDIERPKDHYARTFKYSKDKECLNCAKPIKIKGRYCNKTCMEEYFERTERMQTELTR